jgi:hypothetical protein
MAMRTAVLSLTPSFSAKVLMKDFSLGAHRTRRVAVFGSTFICGSLLPQVFHVSKQNFVDCIPLEHI